jgi:uncharacterized membrane-anchored protein YitT (DUF2179 family)
MNHNRTPIQKLAIQLFWEILGSIFIAAAIYNFAVQAEFPMTGFSGISIILYRFFQIPIGLSTVFLNIPVAFLCYKLLGKKFFISSIRCMLISSFFIDYIAPLFPVYTGDRLLAALCTGIIGGIGYAVIYMQNSSTGGSDFIVMAAKALNPHIPLGKLVLISDVIVILIGGFLLKDMDGIIYGLIVSILFSVAVDKIMYGINAGKMVLIVTKHGPEICRLIDQVVGRGSTIIPSYGGYQQEEKQVIMCACNNKEMYIVQKAVKEADPESFSIILESNEVHGEGFHMLQIGEHTT